MQSWWSRAVLAADAAPPPVAGRPAEVAPAPEGRSGSATLPAKSNVTLFDLLPVHDCGSSPDLAKLVSLLLALDSDHDVANGISIAPAAAFTISGKPMRVASAVIRASD